MDLTQDKVNIMAQSAKIAWNNILVRHNLSPREAVTQANNPDVIKILANYGQFQNDAIQQGFKVPALVEGLTIERVEMTPAQVKDARNAAINAGLCDCPNCISQRSIEVHGIRGNKCDVINLDEHRGTKH